MANTPRATKPEDKTPEVVEAISPSKVLESVEAVAPGLGGEDDDKKVKVKTTGDFMLYDPYTLEVIEADSKGTLVTRTSWIETKIRNEELEVVK